MNISSIISLLSNEVLFISLGLESVPKNRKEFSASGLQGIPEQSGCYVLTTSDGTIVYIGESVNIRQRVTRHFGGGEGEKTKETPWGYAHWVYYTSDPIGELTRGMLEKKLISRHENEERDLPFFNKVIPSSFADF